MAGFSDPSSGPFKKYQIVTKSLCFGNSSGAPQRHPGSHTHTRSKILLQTIETDGATAAVSFEIHSFQYLFITNSGSDGRRRTKSRLYRLSNDGHLLLVRTSYKRKALELCLLNQCEHQRHMDLHIPSFASQVQEVTTTGASDVTYFSHQRQHYVVVTSFQNNNGATDTQSSVYQWDTVANRFLS